MQEKERVLVEGEGENEFERKRVERVERHVVNVKNDLICLYL